MPNRDAMAVWLSAAGKLSADYVEILKFKCVRGYDDSLKSEFFRLVTLTSIK